MHLFPHESHRFSAKRYDSWTHVILVLVFGLGFDHEEITETLQRLKHSSEKRLVITA